jgi:hypothetical protein
MVKPPPKSIQRFKIISPGVAGNIGSSVLKHPNAGVFAVTRYVTPLSGVTLNVGKNKEELL